MIRRTLLNRARRQRDLARTLIARHALMTHDHGQPQLRYRLASSGDAFFAFASSAEPAAPMFDLSTSYMDELAVPLSAWGELPANLEPAAQIVPQVRSADHQPARAEEFVAPLATWPDAPALESDSQANARQDNPPRTPDRAELAAPAPKIVKPEPAQAAPDVADQPVGNTLADLVRRMRAPDWIAPNAATAPKPAPAAAALEPTAKEQITDLVQLNQRPPQHSMPRVERRRIPLGQRMSEAADFGQTPTVAPHQDPIATPAHAEQPSESTNNLPAPTVFKTENPATERSDSAVADLAAPGGTSDSTGSLPTVAGADPEAVAQTIASQMPPPIAAHSDAPMPNPGAPLDTAEPPIAPRALGQASQSDTTPAMTTTLPPSEAPATEAPERLQNLDVTMALPVLATSELHSPADIPAMMMNQATIATDNQSNRSDSVSRKETSTLAKLRQPIEPPTSVPVQFAQAALADTAPTSESVLPHPQAAAATPTAQSHPTSFAPAPAHPEIHQPYDAITELPQQLADHMSAQVAAESDIEPAHTQAAANSPAQSESQRSSSETNTRSVSTQAPASPLPATAEAQSTLPTSAQEPQRSFRQPEASLPQEQTLPSPAHSAQPMVLPDGPTSNASAEPMVRIQPLDGAKVSDAEPASAPVGAAESTKLAPEPIAPLPDQPVSVPYADTVRLVSQPNAAQQPAPNFLSVDEHQIDAQNRAPRFSTHEPTNEGDRARQSERASTHALNVPALEVEAPVAQTAHGQDEAVPALSQPLRAPKPDHTAAEGAPSSNDVPFTTQSTEAPIAHSGELAQEPRALSAVDERDATHGVAHEAAINPVFDAPSADLSPVRAESRIPTTQADERQNIPAAHHQLPVQRNNNPGSITAEHTPDPTAAVAFAQKPHSASPSLDSHPSNMHHLPATAHTIPAAAPSVPMPSSPQAWAARFARHRQLTEPQAEPASIYAAAMPNDQPAAAGVEPNAGVAPAPGSPQAWATRFARHRQLTEPQAEPISVNTPIKPELLAATAANQAPSTSARFIPARRAEHSIAPSISTDVRNAVTERSATTLVATLAAAKSPATAEAGSPEAWAARFARHRELTEPQMEPTATLVTTTPFKQSVLQVPSPARSNATATAEPGSPEAWATRFARHRQLTEPHAASIPAATISSNQPAAAAMDVGTESTAAPDSPQAWAARFARHRQLTEPHAEPSTVRAPETHLDESRLPPAPPQRMPDNQPQIALRHAAPTPIAETTRRFLKPLLGIDPAEARVFRGPAARNVTAAYRAEALASGDVVALAAQHGEDSPATLGVLAHELTHVARQRDAQFVPPLVRRETMLGITNEESLAQSVEAQVRRIAHNQKDATRRDATPPEMPLGRDTPLSSPSPTPIAPRPAAPDPQPSARSDDWAGLPAPWEPLPQWFDAPKPAEMPAPAVSSPLRSAPPAQPAASQHGVSSAPPVQLAETGRMLDAPPAQSAAAPEPAQQPAPDLDALARQVYAVLKQRLAAERRRAQS